MNQREQLEAITRIATACKERGWAHRLPRLREQYAAVRRGESFERLVTDLLILLRLPPFERALPVRAPSEPCPTCGPSSGVTGTFTLVVLEGESALHACKCGERWLVLYKQNEPPKSPERPR